MSDYSKSTNFTAKDGLASGDPNKRINGALFDSEFDPISTAVASKIDKVAGETAELSQFTSSGGLESANITLAGIQALITAATELAWPVGSIYTNASVATNPSTVLGFGTWSSFGAGRVLIGVDSGDTDFDTLEESGGSKTHTLTVAEIPEHSHTAILSNGQVGGSPIYPTGAIVPTLPTYEMNTNNAGGGDAHSIVQPYITVYMWKRTA